MKKSKPSYSTLQRSVRYEKEKFRKLDKRFQDMLLHNQRDNDTITSQRRTIGGLEEFLASKSNLIGIMSEELQKSRTKVEELERALIVASL